MSVGLLRLSSFLLNVRPWQFHILFLYSFLIAYLTAYTSLKLLNITIGKRVIRKNYHFYLDG